MGTKIGGAKPLNTIIPDVYRDYKCIFIRNFGLNENKDTYSFLELSKVPGIQGLNQGRPMSLSKGNPKP